LKAVLWWLAANDKPAGQLVYRITKLF